MPISYTIAIDRNDNGDYTDLSETIQTDAALREGVASKGGRFFFS